MFLSKIPRSEVCLAGAAVIVKSPMDFFCHQSSSVIFLCNTPHSSNNLPTARGVMKCLVLGISALIAKLIPTNSYMYTENNSC